MRKLLKAAGICLAAVLAAASMAGCGSESTEVSVQNVAELAGLGNLGSSTRFAGVVSALHEETLKSDTSKTVSEILVAEGDEVKAGDVLFTYDMTLAQLNIDKAELELNQLQMSLSDKQTEKTTLETAKNNAASSEQLSYTLEIQKCDTEIREYQYNISLKEKDLNSLKESAQISEVKAGITGRVKSVTGADQASSDSSAQEITITITETDAYRIMGYVNENNVADIAVGMDVVVHSRVNSDTWKGTVTAIDWESPASAGSNSSYTETTGSDSSLTGTSKYPFYVELEDYSGLLLGQHVYLEADIADAAGEGIELPSYYFVDVDGGSAYVWAENASGKLEKRSVSISVSDADDGMYEVTSGLAATDYIAFPDDTLKEGQKCKEFSMDDIEAAQAAAETAGETLAGDAAEVYDSGVEETLAGDGAEAYDSGEAEESLADDAAQDETAAGAVSTETEA